MKRSQGLVIGIDEVGRGPWAGPLLVCAVALDMSKDYLELNDSKKLSKKRREILAKYIKREAIDIGLGWVKVSELDKLGMTASLKLATKRAFDQLKKATQQQADRIVVDGNIRLLDDDRVQVVVKADATVPAVSAASIVAKVTRDSYMSQLDRLYPEYGFSRHVGYGTKAHYDALLVHGAILGVHRQSFAPIRQLTD